MGSTLKNRSINSPAFLFLFFFLFILKMTSILSITDSSQLTEFCTVILPTIWTLNISKSRQFIQKVLKATQISCTCILVALYYIHRLRSAYPHIDLSIGSEIRLFTTALILANKYLEDSTFTNKVIMIYI